MEQNAGMFRPILLLRDNNIIIAADLRLKIPSAFPLDWTWSPQSEKLCLPFRRIRIRTITIFILLPLIKKKAAFGPFWSWGQTDPFSRKAFSSCIFTAAFVVFTNRLRSADIVFDSICRLDHGNA